MLVLLAVAAAYFLFMTTEAVFVDMSSHISEIVEVHSDVLVDLLVRLAMMFNAVALVLPWRGCLSSRCWSVKPLGRRSDLSAADRRIELVEYEGL